MSNVLCFGDSNTYGLRPDGSGRFDRTHRWTGILADRLGDLGYSFVEEGLVGRTTVFEDRTRIGRNGSALLPVLLESHSPIDTVILMLGTNDCKSVYNASPRVIGRGIEVLLKQIRAFRPDMRILLISPIHLGDRVWEEEYDPEFSEHSIAVSKALKKTYSRLAIEYDCLFMAASDVAQPSERDQEHMDANSHRLLADAISFAGYGREEENDV